MSKQQTNKMKLEAVKETLGTNLTHPHPRLSSLFDHAVLVA